MPTIRTTIEPWREIVVSDAEAESLARRGLLYLGPDPYVPPPLPPVSQTPPNGTEGYVRVYLSTDPDELVTITFGEYWDLFKQGLILGTEAGGPTIYPGYKAGGDRTLDSHIAAEAPHPTYDDMPSLRLIFENGIT